MVDENKDQVLEETADEEETQQQEEQEETPAEETKEETSEVTSEEEQSKEEQPEPGPDIEEAMRLARASQKGYTLTRQELSTVRQNQEAILKELRRKDDLQEDADEPLTISKFKSIMQREKEDADHIQQKNLEKVDRWIDDLKAQGVIDSQEDEDDLLAYAKERGKRDLLEAAKDWQELKAAQKATETAKVKAKTKVKQDAGSKVGTSQKTKTETTGEIDYEDVHNKSMDEILNEE